MSFEKNDNIVGKRFTDEEYSTMTSDGPFAFKNRRIVRKKIPRLMSPVCYCYLQLFYV